LREVEGASDAWSRSVSERATGARVVCWWVCADEWAWNARGQSLERGPLECGARALR